MRCCLAALGGELGLDEIDEVADGVHGFELGGLNLTLNLVSAATIQRFLAVVNGAPIAEALIENLGTIRDPEQFSGNPDNGSPK